MSYSAHRPGRMDSQGRISFESGAPGGAVTDDDLEFLRTFEPTGEDSGADAASPATHPTAVTDPQPGAAQERDGQEPAAAQASRRPPRPKRVRAPRTPASRLRTLAILGGADGPILDRVPGEAPRFVQMFFVLLGTALVSAISMLFALTTGVQVAIWVAVPLALVWAAIIFNLDRFLTSTMSSTRSVGKLIALALPRVAMAALIGFLVAEPLVLQVFHKIGRAHV